jgi:hypothetical protein
MADNRRKQDASPSRARSVKIPAPGRDTTGKFVKGVCGNPHGRPIENLEVKTLARAHGPAAIARLAQLMHCADPQTCIAASKALLDRGFGRPEQSIALDANVTNMPTVIWEEGMDPGAAAKLYQDMIQGRVRTISEEKARQAHCEANGLPYVPTARELERQKDLRDWEDLVFGRKPPTTTTAPSPAAVRPNPQPALSGPPEPTPARPAAPPASASPPNREIARPRPRPLAVDVDPDDRVISVVEAEDIALRYLRPERVIT